MKAQELQVDVDDLLAAFAIEPSELHEKLFKLQLDGKLEQNFMGFWQSVP